METILRKTGNRYRESITINGRTIKSPVFKRKTDCIQWLAEQRSKRIETSLFGDSFKLRDKMLLETLAVNWLTSKKAAGLSTSTIDSYERYLNVHILPRLGKCDIKKITKNDLEQFQIALSKNHNAKGTNCIITALKSIFSEALKEGYIIRNPAMELKKISEDTTAEAFWTKSEIEQFLRGNHDSHLYPLYITALNTGMRKGELAGLKWDRVDFTLNQITVTRTRDVDGLKERTKTKLRRIIPMNSFVRATLLKHFYARTGSDYIFTKPDGSPIEVHHLYRDFGKAQKKAKIENKIRFHDLRHTFASQFMMNNGNVFDLQKLLGHTDIKMTMRYAHFSPEHLKSAMQGFELGNLNEDTHIPPTAFEKQKEVVVSFEQVSG